MNFLDTLLHFLKEGFFLRSWWKAILVHLAAMGLIVLLFILWFFYIKLPSDTNYDAFTTVPELKGENIEDAIKILKDHKLGYKVIDSTYNANFDINDVITYVPRSGDTVKEDRTIYITVRSVNAPMTRFPADLVENSYTLTQTINRLESLNLRVGNTTAKIHHDNYRVLEIYAGGQQIKGDTMLPIGAKLDIVFGVVDESPTSVPNLVSMTLIDAKKILPSRFLYVNPIYDPNAEEAPGTIIKQKPKAFQTVKKGTQIDVWIAGAEENQPN